MITGDCKNAVLYMGISFLIWSSFRQWRYSLRIAGFWRGRADCLMFCRSRHISLIYNVSGIGQGGVTKCQKPGKKHWKTCQAKRKERNGKQAEQQKPQVILHPARQAVSE